MTNREAIETLNLHNPFMSNNTILSEAMDMAVKSLENSNNVAINTLEELATEIENMDYDFILTEDIFMKIYKHIAELKGEVYVNQY
jgi:hypothetical protein